MTLIIFHVKIVKWITKYIWWKSIRKLCKIPIVLYKYVLNKLNFDKPYYSEMYTLWKSTYKIQQNAITNSKLKEKSENYWFSNSVLFLYLFVVLFGTYNVLVVIICCILYNFLSIGNWIQNHLDSSLLVFLHSLKYIYFLFIKHLNIIIKS